MKSEFTSLSLFIGTSKNEESEPVDDSDVEIVPVTGVLRLVELATFDLGPYANKGVLINVLASSEDERFLPRLTEFSRRASSANVRVNISLQVTD